MSPPRAPINKGKTIFKVNAHSTAHLVKLLMPGIYTCRELADMTGLHYTTVLHYTKTMRSLKAAHIGAWEKDTRGRDVIKIYKLGEGDDALREKMTAAERQARSREKKHNLAITHALVGTVPCAPDL